MKRLSLVLSALALSSYVSAQHTVNYPLLWWNQFADSAPVETLEPATNFIALNGLVTASQNSDLLMLVQDGLST